MWLRVQTFFRKIRYYAKKDVFTLRNIITVIAVLICFYWAWGAITKEKNILVGLTNFIHDNNAKDPTFIRFRITTEDFTASFNEINGYGEYKELMARMKLGKKAEGETMVILPENSENARTKYLEKELEESEYRSNFSQWLDFLFG